jgi:hypothetical protein
MRIKRTVFLALVVLFVGLAGCSGYKSRPVTAAAQISISATSAMAGSPDLTLTITGSNGVFYNAAHNLSQAVWLVNGSDNVLSTTFVSNSMLAAVVPAALLSNPVKAQVFVETGNLKGSVPPVKSNPIFFNVTPGPPGPQISVSPTSASLGSPDLTLTITTSHEQFDNAPHNLSRAVWSVNGVDNVLTTTFVSNSMLTAVVPAALLSGQAEAEVLVETGDPAGSVLPVKSSSVTFDVVSSGAGIWDY